MPHNENVKTQQHNRHYLDERRILSPWTVILIIQKKSKRLPAYQVLYAKAYYKTLARPVDEIPKDKKYICRKNMAGEVFDKYAMLETSIQLGHGRIDVMAVSYLYKNKEDNE